jgi:hypothetical protein
VARISREAAAQGAIAVLGRLRFDATRLPRTDWQDQAATPPVTRLPARLSGHRLGPAGEGPPFDRAITLDIRCLGPWCPQVRSGGRYLAFLTGDEGGPVLVLDPCGGMAIADPSPEVLDRLRACLAGGACTPG